MKILLLTDMPPCSNFTAGLVLERLVDFLPSNNIALGVIMNPKLNPKISEKIKSLPSLWLNKPREESISFLLKRLGCNAQSLGEFPSFAFEQVQSLRIEYEIIPKIINFIKQQNIEAIWIVLQGQTMIRIAYRLTQLTNLPLFTQVWDPFGWWLRENCIDSWTQKLLLSKFDAVIGMSKYCATASWNMSEYYTKKYGVANIPVIASLPNHYSKQAALAAHIGNDFIIGMAGQIYARDEWNCLINTLNQVNWNIAGKNIRIRLLGAGFQITTHHPVNIEYLGWQTQENTVDLLSETDLLYLPYWFSKEFYEEASYSFPSKLVTYFASGRPVFCHAPIYASPAKYIKKYEAGYLCESLDSTVVLQKIEQVITNAEQYQKVAKNGVSCFMRDFTLKSMEVAFFKFLSQSV